MNTTSNGNNGKAFNHRGYYANVWPNWVIKVLGPQPTNEQLAVIHGLKARPGKQALACAMALREAGVTGNEIKGAVALIDGGANPQLNKLRGMVDTAKTMQWVPMPDRAGLHVYRIKLTAFGQAMLKGNAASPVHVTTALKANVAAPKAKPRTTAKKGRKATGKPAGTGTVTGATVTPPTAKPASEAPKAPQQAPARTVLTESGPKPLVPATDSK